MAGDITLGATIRATRERNDLQAKDLAAQCGLDASAISRIESGSRAVRSFELSAIAEALGTSPMALLEPESLVARMPVAARATAGVGVTATRRLRSLAELDEVLKSAGLVRPNRLSEVPHVDKSGWVRAGHEMASRARGLLQSFHNDGQREPFDALVDAIETDLGVDVLVEAHDDPLLGAAITSREFPLIFVNASQNRHQIMFTLAHELGHVLFGTEDPLHTDRDLQANTLDEKIANAFAAAFLMPEQPVREGLARHGRNADGLVHLMLKFGVSLQSLLFRLQTLRLINEATRANLHAVGWSGIIAKCSDENSGRDLINSRSRETPHSPPTPLAMRCIEGVVSGVVSVRPLAGLLHMPEDELAESIAAAEASVLNAPPAEDTDEATDEELFATSPI